VVDAGNTEADSFNDFVVDAIEERLRILREKEIDAAIAEIANDAEYQESAIGMVREFGGQRVIRMPRTQQLPGILADSLLHATVLS
jgi:hypothetical protein